MVRDGYLCAVRGWRVQSEVDLGGVGVRHGDFIEADLARAVDTPERNRLVVDAYRRLAPGRRAIAFCADVAHVHALAAELEAAGYRAASVWGAMAASDREGTLRRFREGKLDVLTNCNVLTEGFDEPRVDCVLMARPTQSQLLYSQMVGRGTRLHPQKSDLVVIDIVDNTARHSLVGLNALFDLAPNLDLAGNNALEVGDELERVAQAFPWVDLDRLSSASQLPLVAERIDLFRFEPPHEISDFTDLAWCRTPDGGYRLPLVDGEWVGVREDNLGRWAVTLHVVHGGDADVVLPAPTNELRSAITGADIVVKRARPDVVRLLTLDASWRDAPVTEKQIELLKRRKIPYPSGITRGQASWMISHSTIRR
jgi:hypothetical protein